MANVLMWVMAGGLAGWVGLRYFDANENRGILISIIIGMVGGFFGGNVLAPMFGEPTTASDTLNVFALFMAVASATACLTIGELLAKRFDI